MGGGRLGELEADHPEAAAKAQHAPAFAEDLGYLPGVDEVEDEAHEHGVECACRHREAVGVTLDEGHPGGIPAPGDPAAGTAEHAGGQVQPGTACWPPRPV